MTRTRIKIRVGTEENLFIYTVDSGNYVRDCDAGKTPAETLMTDLSCPHDEGDCTCAEECEDAVIIHPLTQEKYDAFCQEYGVPHDERTDLDVAKMPKKNKKER